MKVKEFYQLLKGDVNNFDIVIKLYDTDGNAIFTQELQNQDRAHLLDFDNYNIYCVGASNKEKTLQIYVALTIEIKE